MIEAALREVREETGLRCEYKDLLVVRENNNSTYDNQDMYFGFLMQCNNYNVTIDKSELNDYRWLPLDQIP